MSLSLNKSTGTDVFQILPLKVICKHPLVKPYKWKQTFIHNTVWMVGKRKTLGKIIVLNSKCLLYSGLRMFLGNVTQLMPPEISDRRRGKLNSTSAVQDEILLMCRGKQCAIWYPEV